VRSAGELLDAVQTHAQNVRGGLVYGHGWDETNWPDRTLPTRGELDRAAWGSEVYLARVDVHSALISSALVARVREITEQAGYSSDGPVEQIAHEMARTAALERLSSASRERAQQATLHEALANGIVAVHEMAGPSIGGAQDAQALRALSDGQPLPKVDVYWGEVASPQAFETARDIGAYGLGGDLFVDGSLGSRTAALVEPYADAPTHGRQYLSRDEIEHHIRLTTEAGIPGGFHVIGDAACQDVTRAFESVALDLGADRVRGAGHRLEHAEMHVRPTPRYRSSLRHELLRRHRRRRRSSDDQLRFAGHAFASVDGGASGNGAHKPRAAHLRTRCLQRAYARRMASRGPSGSRDDYSGRTRTPGGVAG